jgi:fused signal recognition particle receptor
MTWLDKVLGLLQGLLANFGVPEANRPLTALVVLYAVAVLLVVLALLVAWRLRRKPAAPPAEETPLPTEPATEAPVAEDTVPPVPAEPPAAEELAGEEPPAALPVAEAPPAVAEPVTQEVLEPRPEPVPERAPSLFERMRAGLAKTQASVVGRLDGLLRGRQGIDAELFEDLEEILVTADFGLRTSQELIVAIKSRLSREGGSDPQRVRDLLREEISQRLRQEAAPAPATSQPPQVTMVVGVNGVGKTTTIGKLARQFADQGKKVVLGAGDTFRAAAAEQLAIWGERSGVDVIRHAEGADPAAVAFDAAKAAVARHADILILDTAGRLHTKVNLMEELKKIRRVLAREIPGAPHETLLVLDATTGQNALSQARLFKEAVEVTGLVLTKLDGTAKGGIVVAIGAELGLPVRFVGIGEGVEDLRPFDPDLFVAALFPDEERP